MIQESKQETSTQSKKKRDKSSYSLHFSYIKIATQRLSRCVHETKKRQNRPAKKLLHSRGCPAALGLWVYLCSWVVSTGQYFKKTNIEIADELGIDRKTVITLLHLLVEQGLIESKSYRVFKDGEYRMERQILIPFKKFNQEVHEDIESKNKPQHNNPHEMQAHESSKTSEKEPMIKQNSTHQLMKATNWRPSKVGHKFSTDDNRIWVVHSVYPDGLMCNSSETINSRLEKSKTSFDSLKFTPEMFKKMSIYVIRPRTDWTVNKQNPTEEKCHDGKHDSTNEGSGAGAITTEEIEAPETDCSDETTEDAELDNPMD